MAGHFTPQCEPNVTGHFPPSVNQTWQDITPQCEPNVAGHFHTQCEPNVTGQ
jgi:hypothetical protein